MRARALMLAIIGSVAAASSDAFAFTDADRAEARRVVAEQLEAFRRGDGPGAYAKATPAIRDMFGSPEGFMAMVRQGYPPVYRPGRTEFGPARDSGEFLEQALRIDDQDGAGWDAIYSLERQPDGTWAISGCRLVKAPDTSV